MSTGNNVQLGMEGKTRGFLDARFPLSLACVFLAFSSPGSAQAGELLAYIDPFTGSLVLQFLAAVFFGVVVFFKSITYRIKTLLGFRKDTQADDDLELHEAQTIRFNETDNDAKKAA